MSWSYRKSFGSGPFRVNFSKSGVSYSIGVKGARVNMGPKGTYVNLSSHGISYRKRIDMPAQDSPTAPAYLPAQPYPAGLEQGHQIASAAIDQLSDTDSRDFIQELTTKAGQVSYVNWFGVLPLIIFLSALAFTTFSSKSVLIHPASDSIGVKVTSMVGAYIRRLPSAKSQVVKSAAAGEMLGLADSAHRSWLKVSFHDTVGYINSRYAQIVHAHQDLLTTDDLTVTNPYAGYILIVGLAGFIVLFRWLKKQDRRRFELALHYEMDEQFKAIYTQFHAHFTTFSASRKIWQYLNTQRTYDAKRNAGAGNLIKRTPLASISGNHFPLQYLVTNVNIPYLKLTNLELYFLPERLLVKRGGTFAAVFYKNLKINRSITQFVEEEGVAADATVIGHTWKYVNRNGGPDRRFNNNRQIPLCAYSQYTLTSDTGVYEILTTSKQGAMDGFAEFLAQIGNLQARMSIAY
jgi:hypothetical protein